MRLGIIANMEKPGAKSLVLELRREFAKHPVQVEFEHRTAQFSGLKGGMGTKELGESCDLLIVLGGDGTILEVLHNLDGKLPPIFGINIGTLGFLTCAGASAYLEIVESIVSNRYQLSRRTLLHVEKQCGESVLAKGHALNDAVISRGELSRLIRLNVRIEGALLTEYNADGLIVATPTGSTAYSLSAGGPLLEPTSGVFVITPICPHVLTNRSVIVGDACAIEISPCHDQKDVFVTLDGRNVWRIEPEQRVRITKSTQTLDLAMPPHTTFFEVLRQKLKWSGAAV